MRLTRVLQQMKGFKERHVLRMKRKRVNHGYISEEPLSETMMNFAQQAGIELEDPNDLWNEPKHKFPEWTPPIKLGDKEALALINGGSVIKNPYEDIESIDLKPRADASVTSYCYTPDLKLMEGLQQAALLTKTQTFYGRPERVTDRLRQVTIPHQDELAQRIIMQANAWDCDKQRLQRHRDPHVARLWKYKSEWGPPEQRIVHNMLSNLLRLFDSQKTRYSDMCRRALTQQQNVIASYYYDGIPITIHGCNTMMLTSQYALQPFADQSLVEKSVTHRMPDMYPVSPLIDLKANLSEPWMQTNSLGLSRDVSAAGAWHAHTGFQHVDVDLCDDNIAARHNVRSLFMCFSQCVADARRLYGADVTGVLPAPVCSQHVAMDAMGGLYFTFYQLNTLDCGGDTAADDVSGGVKNMAWFDNKRQLYSKLLPKRGMLRHTRYVDYDPEVLDQLFTVYMMDVDLERSAPEQSFRAKKTDAAASRP